MASGRARSQGFAPRSPKIKLDPGEAFDLNPSIFNPAAGQLPSPEAMAAYAAIDPTYPKFLQDIFSAELRRNYRYQLIALIAGWSFGAILLAGAVFLVYTGHPKMASCLIGANFLGLATRMLTKGATRRG